MVPKPELFAQESSVTIAIGLLASDGIVLAADREEGDLYQKIDQGKIRARYQDAAPYNTMMVGGAGSGAYADAFSEEVLQWFSKTHPFDTESIETALRTLNKTFYKEHVIPLGTYPAQERPDYALLAVCKTSEGSGLWTSDHLVLNRKYPYAAIGSGALTARALLNELYAYVPVISAINLAVYVIGEVKRFVPGCGLDTDVLFASADSPPVKIVGDDLRPCSHNAAFQKRECILNGIRMNIAANVLLRSVIDGLMLRVSNRMFVGLQAVRDDYIHVCADVLTDVFLQGAGLRIFSMKESEFPVALSNADHYFLVRSGHASSGITLFATDISFIHFDSTIQHGQFGFFHRSTNAMAEIPCGFIAHPNSTLDLIRRDSLACFAEQQSDHEPFGECQMRIMEDRARRDRELIIALGAVEQLVATNEPDNFLSAAARTFGTIWPTQSFQQFPALLISREHLSNFRESHCAYPV